MLVLPAQAGVILKRLGCESGHLCAPRAGGGDPLLNSGVGNLLTCSPRRRG